jgi:hypothetical protein
MSKNIEDIEEHRHRIEAEGLSPLTNPIVATIRKRNASRRFCTLPGLDLHCSSKTLQPIRTRERGGRINS